MHRSATNANTAELRPNDFQLLFLPIILNPDDPFRPDLGLVSILGDAEIDSCFMIGVCN